MERALLKVAPRRSAQPAGRCLAGGADAGTPSGGDFPMTRSTPDKQVLRSPVT